MQPVLQILAMVLSPLFASLVALEVNRRLTVAKEARSRRQQLFNSLMVTSGDFGVLGRLSPEHVRALNLIEIEFYGDEYKAVIDAWREYLTCLNSGPAVQWSPETADAWNAWNKKRDDLLVKLLYEMAQALGYKFDQDFIRTAAYAPIGYLSADLEVMKVRQQVQELLDGKRTLHISTLPPEPKAALGPEERPALDAAKPAMLPPGATDEPKK